MKKAKLTERVTQLVLSCKEGELASLKVEGIAEKLGVNSSYLSRRFNGEKNMTLNEFITGVKMWRCATQLSKNRSVSIQKMSDIMGYSRSDYFVTLFKQQFGIHPKAFGKIGNDLPLPSEPN
jgi:two-component system, response regulator YesN